MIKRVKDNFMNGLQQVRWFSSVMAERVKVEMAVIRLLFRSDEMEKKKDLLLRTIGERVYECKGLPDKNVMRDREVVEAISEIERLDKDIEELKHRVSEISSIKA